MKDVREEITAYIDGELNDARRREVEQAVAQDPALQTEVDMLRRLKKSFNPEPSPLMDGMVRERATAYSANDPAKEALLQKLKKQEPKGFRAALRPYRLVAAGAVGLALLATVVQMNPLARNTADAASESVAFQTSASAPAMASVPGEELAKRESSADSAAPSSTEAKEMDSAYKANVFGGGSLPSTTADIPTLRNEREVIQSSNIGVAVPDAYKGLNQVNAIAVSLGGYLENKSFNRASRDMPMAMATLKVPSAKYDSALQSIRDLGEVREESQQADDVTKAAVAYRAEIDQLKRKINALDARLRTARGSEAREIRWRLTELQGQLTSQQVVSKRLAAETAISTIAVTLYEKDKIKIDPANENWSENVWNQAVNNFGVAGRVLGAVAVNILVFSPIWLPFLIVAWMKNRKSQ